MKELRVSREAQEEVLEIWRYLYERSESAADRIVDEITSRYETLAMFPGMGRSREELGPGYRSFVVDDYIIYYRLVEEGVLEISHVLHGARDTERIFQEEGEDN